MRPINQTNDRRAKDRLAKDRLAKDELESHFSANAMRLTGRQWLVVLLLVLPAIGLASPLWKHVETWEHGPDYRVPYELSRDYWLYERHLEEAARESEDAVFIIGDSVVWGEYVRADGTLSHYLNEYDGATFVNAGINGLFPLALEGLANSYMAPVRDRKVVLHCNLLWMSSAEADLSSTKEQKFNHVQLVPQFFPRIPCYRATLEERLSTVAHRSLPGFAWNSHLQICYYDGQSVPKWTMESAEGLPARSKHAYEWPWSPLTMHVPAEADDTQQRGPASPRHAAWNARGLRRQSFNWRNPSDSLQWAAFQRLVRRLRRTGNDVLVVTGPFNTHLVDDAGRRQLAVWEQAVADWLHREGVACVVPPPLSSQNYADASHPLTQGYREWARLLMDDPQFRDWLYQNGSGAL